MHGAYIRAYILCTFVRDKDAGAWTARTSCNNILESRVSAIEYV